MLILNNMGDEFNAYNWVNIDYIYIRSGRLFWFSDVITIMEIIKRLKKIYWYSTWYINLEKSEISKYDKELCKYYELLWNSILKWINSKYTIDNYIKWDFWIKNEYWDKFSYLYEWLLMMRKSYHDLVTCFSRDNFWIRWNHVSEYKDSQMIAIERIYYNENIEKYKSRISSIDCIISNNIWEDSLNYVSLENLVNKFWFDIDLNYIENRFWLG